jgi:hypothetical protein
MVCGARSGVGAPDVTTEPPLPDSEVRRQMFAADIFLDRHLIHLVNSGNAAVAASIQARRVAALLI